VLTMLFDMFQFKCLSKTLFNVKKVDIIWL